MKQLLMIAALTLTLSGTVLAGDMPGVDAPAPGDGHTVDSPAPGDVQTGQDAPGDIPTCGMSALLTILDLAF